MAVYAPPNLPYDCIALESYISGMTVELHHGKRHANYVSDVDAALKKPEAVRESGDFAVINLYKKNFTFNLGDHTSHAIF